MKISIGLPNWTVPRMRASESGSSMWRWIARPDAECVGKCLVRHADESLYLNTFHRFRLPVGQRNGESDPDGGDCGLDDAKTHSVVGAPPLTDPFGVVPAPRTVFRIEKAPYSTSGGRYAPVRMRRALRESRGAKGAAMPPRTLRGSPPGAPNGNWAGPLP